MSILDATRQIRTKITYDTCRSLGMRPVDTLTPQYSWCVERKEVCYDGVVRPIYVEFVQVFFENLAGNVVVFYTNDDQTVNGRRRWQKLINISAEELHYLVSGLDAEFNTKSDFCHVCGFDGEIVLNKDMEWECPQCGNKEHAKMNVTRRTCGYLGENFWNVGKTKEINSRVLHL